jgi:hypothetical protein
MQPALADGIYRLDYRTATGDAVFANGLAIVRNNEILGSDPAGGLFKGQYLPGDDQRPGAFEGYIALPPNGELITGLRAGPDGLDIALRGVSTVSDTALGFLVEVAGQIVSVDVAYVGPLPATGSPSR